MCVLSVFSSGFFNGFFSVFIRLRLFRVCKTIRVGWMLSGRVFSRLIVAIAQDFLIDKLAERHPYASAELLVERKGSGAGCL